MQYRYNALTQGWEKYRAARWQTCTDEEERLLFQAWKLNEPEWT